RHGDQGIAVTRPRNVWILDAALVVPLLVIFAYLGARYPSAGGIAGFVGAAFGRRGGAAAEVLLLGRSASASRRSRSRARATSRTSSAAEQASSPARRLRSSP